MSAANGRDGFYEGVAQRKLCCAIRKVEPLGAALAGRDAWITGQRREQAVTRGALPEAEADTDRDMQKYNPLADWDLGRDVLAYAERFDIPMNPLYDRGYRLDRLRTVHQGDQARRRSARWPLVVGKRRTAKNAACTFTTGRGHLSGTVYLVGAGPGAADLLTLRAARLLGEADVVLHDALVGADVLAFAPKAKLYNVGKRANRPVGGSAFHLPAAGAHGTRHADGGAPERRRSAFVWPRDRRNRSLPRRGRSGDHRAGRQRGHLQPLPRSAHRSPRAAFRARSRS